METDYSNVIHVLPGLVWTALPDGRADFVNRRWCEYAGVSFEEALGEGWLAPAHPADRPGLLERWRLITAANEPAELEARLRRADGEYRWFLLRVSPIADASGTVTGWCGVNTDIDDRKRREETSQARGRNFEQIVDGLPAILALFTADGKLAFCNRQMLEYLDETFEQVQSKASAYNFHPADRDAVLAQWSVSVASGEPFDFEARLRRADGAYRWQRTRVFPLRNTEGHIDLWYGLCTDIDDRKWAETLLAGEKQLLSMVAQGVPLAEVLGALCRVVEDAAPGRLCSVLSIAPDGVRFRHGAGPSLPSAYNEVLDGLIMDRNYGPCGMAANLKTQVIAEDVASDPRWAASPWPGLVLGYGLRSCWSTPILSGDDRVIGVLALYQTEPACPSQREHELIRQFTQIAGVAIERAQSDASLHLSEALLSEAQRLTQTGSFSWRVATGEIAWSEQVYRMFEYDVATPVTLQLLAARVHPEDQPLLDDMVERARRGVSDFEYEHRLLLPDGSIKHLHLMAHGTPDQRGQMEYIGAVQDVTERRVSEQALSKVRSELTHMARVNSLGALTASIAHEVNQPLSGIITNASTCLRMLAADPPNIAGAQETARRTVRDGNRAADIIKRLRTLFAKRDTASEPVDLSEAAREVIALTGNDLRRSRVIVRSELAEGLPPVIGDRVQLQQVILNLLLNAADAMKGVEGRPRLLTIGAAREDGDCVRLTVRDAGVGLDPEGTTKLFDAFYTTKSEGMGIGLSISRTIVENHGGRLWAEANDGPGATFAFSVPGCSEDPSVARASQPVVQSAAVDPPAVMVKR